MQIIPTIGLKKDFGEAEARIREVYVSSRWIQIDVSDNIFAPGKTFELELLNKLDFRAENNLWDVHLMVKEPINWIEKCITIGASRIIGQVEMMTDRMAFLDKVKGEGIEAGLAFDIETPVGKIEGDWDMVLVMGRRAGFGHFELDERVYNKIKKVKEMGYVVGVDGGVNVDNVDMLEGAGVDVVFSEINYWKLINGR